MNNEIKIQPSKGNNKVEISNNFAQYFEQLAKKHADDAKESSLLAKDWANKLGSTVDDTEYSAKHYALKSKEEHDGAVTDIATAKTDLEQSIATGLENYNTNAQAKSDSLQKQLDTSISNIKKQETTSINAVKTTQTTAETSITELKTSAELTITNGMADITANKEQSMSAIDENRISSIEEISNTKTTAISDVSTAGAEQVSNIKKTGFYMQDDKLYYINADGETKEFISGGGRELLEIYIDPFCDESENKGRIANGQIIIQSQFKDVTKKLKKRVGWDSENKKATLNTSLVCTEEEWQAIKTASKLGQCGKFVIDDEAGTIRLPAIININGLTDLSKAGLTKEESLPNISGMFVTATPGEILKTNGCIKSVAEITSADVRTRGSGIYGFRSFRMNVDTSGSSATYQDNAPVQQEAVQYPYVICVNTGVEEAERPINNYQVNNTNSYGDSKYVGDMTLNNASWLKSTGQANSGTVHTGFYKWAVANIGQPFGAGYITGPKMYGYSKNTDYHYATINEVPKVGDPIYGAVSGRFVGNIESVDITNGTISFHNSLQQNESTTASRDTKYDVTTTNPYFLIVDQANQTFILPTLNGSEDLLSDKYENLTLGASGQSYIAPANGWVSIGKMNTENLQEVGLFLRTKDGGQSLGTRGTAGKATNAFTSLRVYKNQIFVIVYSSAGTLDQFKFVYAKGNGNLYYYVGDTLQNTDLINIARMQEQKADKSEIDGPWVCTSKNLIAYSANNFPANYRTTFDLSSYLPEPGCKYELIVDGYGETSAAWNGVSMGLRSSCMSTLVFKSQAGSTTQTHGCGNIIVGQDRQLTVYSTSSRGTNQVRVDIKAYRRVV